MMKNNSHNDNNLEAKYSHFLVHLGLQIYAASQIYFEKNDLVFKDILPDLLWVEKNQSHYCISHLSTSPSTQNDDAFSILVYNAEQVHEAQLWARENREAEIILLHWLISQAWEHPTKPFTSGRCSTEVTFILNRLIS